MAQRKRHASPDRPAVRRSRVDLASLIAVARRAAIGSIAAVAIGCARPPACGDWCGTATIAFYAGPDALLPPLATSDIETALSDQLFLKIADIGPSLNTAGTDDFTPILATDWVREDSLTIVFALNADARWHDGRPVTARDVAFTFDVYRDPAVGASSSARLKHIQSVTARDSLTVVFQFTRTYLEQFFDAVYHMRIIPEHVWGDVPRDSMRMHPAARRPVGSGPYRLVRWTPGESGELVADSAFFRGRPGLRRVVWRVTPDRAAMVAQLVAGEADVVSYLLPTPANLRLVRESEHLRLVEYASGVYNYMGFNFRDPDRPDRQHPLFADRDVRRAIAMAIDREAVVRATLGEYGVVPPGPLVPLTWIWSDGIEQPPYDTAGARRLLAERGWRDRDGDGVLDRGGRPLSFELSVPSSSTSRVQSAVIIQDQLKRLGIDVRIAEDEFNTWGERVRAGRFDAQLGSILQDPSPVSMEDWTSSGIGTFNYGTYVNPAVDRLVGEALSSNDRAVAIPKWEQVIALMNADAPAVWLAVPRLLAVVHARFENVSLRPDAWWSTLWTWRVVPSERIQRDLLGGS